MQHLEDQFQFSEFLAGDGRVQLQTFPIQPDEKRSLRIAIPLLDLGNMIMTSDNYYRMSQDYSSVFLAVNRAVNAIEPGQLTPRDLVIENIIANLTKLLKPTNIKFTFVIYGDKEYLTLLTKIIRQLVVLRFFDTEVGTKLADLITTIVQETKL